MAPDLIFQMASHHHLQLGLCAVAINDFQADVRQIVEARQIEQLSFEHGKAALASTFLVERFETNSEAVRAMAAGMFARCPVEPFA